MQDPLKTMENALTVKQSAYRERKRSKGSAIQPRTSLKVAYSFISYRELRAPRSSHYDIDCRTHAF